MSTKGLVKMLNADYMGVLQGVDGGPLQIWELFQFHFQLGWKRICPSVGQTSRRRADDTEEAARQTIFNINIGEFKKIQ